MDVKQEDIAKTLLEKGRPVSGYANKWILLEKIEEEISLAKKENRKPDIIHAVCDCPDAKVIPILPKETGTWLLNEGEGYTCDHCGYRELDDTMPCVCKKCGIKMDCATMPDYYEIQGILTGEIFKDDNE